jgi:hypothetical protein
LAVKPLLNVPHDELPAVAGRPIQADREYQTVCEERATHDSEDDLPRL